VINLGNGLYTGVGFYVNPTGAYTSGLSVAGGIVIGSNSSPGVAQVTGGLNVGSASGAGTGQIATSGVIGAGVAPSAVIRVKAQGTSTGATAYGFASTNSAATNLFYTRDDGYVWVSGMIDVGSLNNRSDARLKGNIASIPDALGLVLAIPASRWTLLDDSEQRIHYGPVAQEVERVAPELVHEARPGPDEPAPREGRGRLSYDLGGLVGLLLGAVQQLAARITALEERRVG
jgi:hypothetical protein